MKNPILKLLIVIFVVTFTSIAYAQQTGSYTVSYKDVEILQDKFGNISANTKLLNRYTVIHNLINYTK